ncbi:MAG: hypothetical protein ACRDFB_02415 [Rhabdochlamydiaceae bacterium]
MICIQEGSKLKPVEKQSETERTLNKRLKFIGYILIGFAAITLIWDFFPEEEEEFDELLLEMEETAPPPINSYLISATFALVGSSCLLIYWKKKAALKNNA